MTTDPARGPGGAGPLAGWPPVRPRPPRRPVLRRIVVGWAVVLAAVTLYSVFHFKPTGRDQTSIAQALPTVDGAVADLVTAAGADAVPAITGYVAVDRGCRITAVREGARYQRQVRLFTAAGGEGALLTRLAAHLPARYRARVGLGSTLHAGAGNFVTVSGEVVGPGQVRLVADTGCRPQNRPVVEAVTGQPPDRAPVEAALVALGVRAARWETHRVACAGGGAVWTVQADTAPGISPADLGAAFAGAAPVLARPDAVAYRRAGAGVAAVRADGGALTVTATTGCQ